MTDTPNDQNTPTPGAPGTTPPPGQGQQDVPGPVPYARFKEVNDSLKALQERVTQFEQAEQARKDSEAKAKGDFERLLTERERELATARTENMRLKVATEKGLPAPLVDRLRGDTLDDMRADADALLALVPAPVQTPSTPGVPRGTFSDAGNTALPDLSKMTPEQIREWSAKSGWGKR